MHKKLVFPLWFVLPDKPATAENRVMGRQLESMTVETDTEELGISYSYDMSGMRSSKTVVYGVGEAHTHEYTSAVTAPTCTTAGYTTYTCDCGESYVDNLVDALGHNYVQSGNVYTCSRCGDSYTGHEHSYTEETTQPTCTTAGYTVYTCSCGDSYTVDIPALGHNYVLVGQSGNVATYECSRCGHRYTAVIPVDPQPPVEYSLRSSNTVTEHHEYVYMSGLLMRETITTTANGTSTTEVLDFVYGSGSTPLALVYTNGTANPVTYYYVTNMQGDVVKMVTAGGTVVASYAYDAWGKVLSATGSMAEVNPIRYRGYHYDAEIGMYYLQSRYYDPAVKRFINADGVTTTGQGFLGQNMFAYCNNSPQNYVDSSGCAATWTNTYVENPNRISFLAELFQEKPAGQNVENMMEYFNVDSVEDLPALDDGCMVFAENISAISLGFVTLIYGKTILMDNDKYCEYTFFGPSFGVSVIPFDYCMTTGYVYDVYDVDDYCGFFVGGSFNGVIEVHGGAFAFNGVTQSITQGTGLLSASLGISFPHYSAESADWIYGKANIQWLPPIHRPLGPYDPEL